MTIGTIVLVSIVGLIGLTAATFCVAAAASEKSVGAAVGAVVSVLIAAAICIGVSWWQLNSESGKRAFKTQQSNLNGGITRVVTVYDVNGEEITRYKGKFDVDHTDDRIMFDDENGNRHIVYYTTGTITVDEVD